MYVVVGHKVLPEIRMAVYFKKHKSNCLKKARCFSISSFSSSLWPTSEDSSLTGYFGKRASLNTMDLVILHLLLLYIYGLPCRGLKKSARDTSKLQLVSF